TLPFSIGPLKGKKLNSESKKIYQFAKVLIRKTKGHFYLVKLFNEVGKSYSFNNEELAEIIFDLVQNKVLLPIISEKVKKKFAIHF
ncbi:unnamed protein product, partial [marine sediment metagenome]